MKKLLAMFVLMAATAVLARPVPIEKTVNSAAPAVGVYTSVSFPVAGGDIAEIIIHDAPTNVNVQAVITLKAEYASGNRSITFATITVPAASTTAFTNLATAVTVPQGAIVTATSSATNRPYKVTLILK